MVHDRKKFVFQRRINWGDTDAAGIVYTVRVPQFCMEALEAWFIEVVGADWFELNTNRQTSTPFVNIMINFHSMLTPRDALFITVAVKRLGNSSLSFALEGRAEHDRLAFDAAFTCVFVNTVTNQPIPIADEYRARIAAHMQVATDGKAINET